MLIPKTHFHAVPHLLNNIGFLSFWYKYYNCVKFWKFIHGRNDTGIGKTSRQSLIQIVFAQLYTLSCETIHMFPSDFTFSYQNRCLELYYNSLRSRITGFTTL